ncbi:MAG: hypothetical protein A2173_10090 [Planctomycetes bacterium RBG_13_44_8b]|nr:MAG: hypothetical protein A2173_10090 [Planctomycetes bacterium RBG_13_44_8b]
MGTDYLPNNFIRKTPNCLLEQYLQSKGIIPQVEIEVQTADGEKQRKKVKVSELEENQFKPIIALIESQTPEKQAEIENDFMDINERACKAGIACLIEESQWEGHNLDISDDIEQMSNHYERAMWVYLNYPEVFKNSGHFQKMDSVTFKKAFIWKGLTPNQLDSELEDFKQKMIEHYKKEGRGKHCKVEVLKRSDPERYCYFVKLEDYGDIIEEFEGEKPVKPIFEVIFVYHPESGRIENNAKGKKDQIEQLHEAFCQGVLNMEKLPDNNSRIYNLEKLKTRFNFMPRDSQDNITSVKLKFLELEVDFKRRISFTDNGNRSDIYNLIDDALNQHNIPLDSAAVTKVIIQIMFKKMAGERRARSVTFNIGTPDSCSLKDSATHLIAQKYVEKWGLI